MLDARKFAPRRLKGEDVPEEGVVVVFTKVVELNSVYDEGDEVLGVYSNIFPYWRLEPNATQFDVLIDAFGFDAHGWVGHSAQLSREELKTGQFAGKYTIIVEPIPGEAQPVATEEADIPF